LLVALDFHVAWTDTRRTAIRIAAIIRGMKRALAAIAVILAVIACSDSEQEKPLSEDGEKLYDIRGRILSRDAGDNTVRVDHERIEGFMEAMVMDYSVRGAKVATLPPDNVRFAAKLHVTDNGYWLTDVKAAP
jgi:Copper binding periplasmic protein CusF